VAEGQTNIVAGKTVAIHQPNFLPWAGYFYKISKADLFIFLDDVQFSKNNYINRSQILVGGKKKWLSVPARVELGTSINNVMLNNLDWKQGHLNLLKNSYQKHRHFNDIWPNLTEAYERINSANLSQINIQLIMWLMKKLNISTKICRASSFLRPKASDPTQRLVDLVVNSGGAIYLSGLGGKKYQDEALFLRGGVEVVYSSFRSGPYSQESNEFTPGLSILDVVFSLGWDATASYIQKGN